MSYMYDAAILRNAAPLSVRYCYRKLRDTTWEPMYVLRISRIIFFACEKFGVTSIW